jgi:outer membrane protein
MYLPTSGIHYEKNRKKPIAIALCSLAVISLPAFAEQGQEGSWLVRLRAVHLNPSDDSDPIGGVGASDRLTVNSRMIPDINISYFFTPNWATELVLTFPQKQKIELDGAKIGSFNHLPPTLTLQYHFMPEQQFSPYVGAGVNYTRITNVNLLGGAGKA